MPLSREALLHHFPALPTDQSGPAAAPRQQVETALLTTLRLQQALLDNLPDLAWIKDGQSRFVVVNRALASFIGRPPEEIIGRTDFDLFPHEHGTAYRALDEEVFLSGTPRKILEVLRSSDGEDRWVETVKAPIPDESGRIIGTGGFARDVTIERRAELERAEFMRDLERERARLNDIIENVPGVVWEVLGNPAGDGSHVAYVSPYLTQLAGPGAAEHAGSWRKAIHRDDAERVLRELDEAYTERRSCRIELRIVTAQRGTVWCEAHCSVITDEEGQAAGMRGVLIDIDERKRSEALLRESEARFRTMADNAPVIIWTTSAAGACQFTNQLWMTTTGQSQEDALGMGWLSVVEAADLDRVSDTVRLAATRREAFSLEFRIRSKSGELRQVLSTAAPRFDAAGRFMGHIGTCFDLTDLRRLERQLEDEKRVSGLGRLAATIAHEMNNVLMGIQPFAELIRRRGDASMEDAGARIVAAVERGKRVTHEILRFTRSAEPVLRPFGVPAWLEALAPELQSRVGAGVELTIDVAEGLPPVLADRLQLQQVLVNLATNGRDAMNGCGALRITVRHEKTGMPRLDGTSENFLHFTVSDDGAGIEEALLDRIFEPLFTTKRNNGTGLGLTIVHQIVTKHGGRIFVESERGKGSTFHFFLQAAGRNAAESVELETTACIPPHVRSVLMVEDDPLVAYGILHLLEAQNLRVMSAVSGAGALGQLASDTPDVAILDVALPDMNGIQLFNAIRMRYPRLPVIFSTGHGDERMLAPQLASPHTTFLLKPYRLESLIGAIARVTGDARK
ncbi:MAG TPA: PAS domain S-box protein [Thermoanaerobaculia bacterium]|jgi:PAS domain S-box-containing protein